MPDDTIALAAVLDIQAAEPLRQSFLSARGRTIGVDASQVERLGALCLQVLLAAQKTWSADGLALTFGPVSPAFSEQWTGFGAPPMGSASQGSLS